MNHAKALLPWFLGVLALAAVDQTSVRCWFQSAHGAEGEIRQFIGHTGYVYGAVFLPDGKSALSYSFDRTVRRWDVASGQQTAKYDVRSVNDIAVLPDGKRALFAQGADVSTRKIIYFDLEKGEEIRSWTAHDMGVFHVRLLPDGKHAVSSSADGTVILWEFETGTKLRAFVPWRQGDNDGIPANAPRQGGGVAIAVSPDGKVLATGTSRNKEVALWDIQTGAEIRSWPGEHGGISSIEYSPDGLFVLTSSMNDGKAGAQIWDVATGKLVREWQIGYTSSAVFSPDGKLVLTAGIKKVMPFLQGQVPVIKGEVRLWDVHSQKLVREYSGHEKNPTRAEFSPDGKIALTTGYDKVVRVWRITK